MSGSISAFDSFTKGLAAFDEGKYDSARSEFEEALRCDDEKLDKTVVLLHLGIVCRASGDARAAVTHLSTILPTCSTKLLPEVYYELGQSYRRLGEMKQAISFFRRGVIVDGISEALKLRLLATLKLASN